MCSSLTQRHSVAAILKIGLSNAFQNGGREWRQGRHKKVCRLSVWNFIMILFNTYHIDINIYIHTNMHPHIYSNQLQHNCGKFNFNVCLRKSYIIVLLKLLPILGSHIFSFFRNFVELTRLGGQEWMQLIFDSVLRCEPYSSNDVLHLPEQMMIKTNKV